MLVLLMGRIYEVTTEVSSGDMTYAPSFIKIGSSIQMLLVADKYTDTQRARWFHKSDFISSRPS
jgi:hypothetical protein